ncbi:MAG: hypothetical protein K0R67_972 [Paenibacillus sp.]|nr:hypothetical protein [Paenibacillus sp.]
MTGLQVGFIVLLFMLVYVAIRMLLRAVIRRSAARSRLAYVHEQTISSRVSRYMSRYNRLYRHLNDLLESLQYKLSLGALIYMTTMLVLGGGITGAMLLGSIKGTATAALMAGSLPYIILRMKLISLQMKARLDFLPAVELFYQYYLVAGQRNIRKALQITLEENRMMYPMKAVFQQLNHNLTTNRSVDDSLRVLTVTLGHLWADYFANIMRVGLVEGNEIGDNLKELITDMRRAQRSDQAERNRLLEIRLANFSSFLFLLVFLAVNFKLNFSNAWHYYVEDPDGRNMVLDGGLFIFGSFLMGLYLSVRRM